MGNCDHEKGDIWLIQSIKVNLENQRINLDMIPSEKKDVYFQCYLIQFQQKTTFSLLYTEVGIGNKEIVLFYSWITKYIESSSNEEIEMSNNIFDLQDKQIQNKKLLEQINQQNITKIADLTTEKKFIELALKNKVGTNRFSIYGDLKLEFIEEVNKLTS